MIIDLKKFISEEQPFWRELEALLDRMEKQPDFLMDIEGVKRFHYLYQRASTGLAKIMILSAEQEIRRFLESLVARAYSEIHETRFKTESFSLIKWLFSVFPCVFRKYAQAFWLSFIVMFSGALFGGIAIYADPEAKYVLIPFEHLMIAPEQRVANEEANRELGSENTKARFSSFLIVNNIKVSITVLAMGMTFGIGTIIILFFNGVILGAVCADYLLAGQAKFLLGWLLPHGAVEIPAILLAGQAGLVLAKAIIGWEHESFTIRDRLRKISDDLVTLIAGIALLLVWAGLVEAFFSQYHEPLIPYSIKITFGMIELLLLTVFLLIAGKQSQHPTTLKGNDL